MTAGTTDDVREDVIGWAAFSTNRHGRPVEGHAYETNPPTTEHLVALLQLSVLGPDNPCRVYVLPDGELGLLPGMILRYAKAGWALEQHTLETVIAICTQPAASVNLAKGLLTMPKTTVRDAGQYAGDAAGADLSRRPIDQRVRQLYNIARDGRKTENQLNLIFSQAEQLKKQIDAERERLDQAEGVLHLIGQAILGRGE